MSYLYPQHGPNKYVLLMSTAITKNSALHLNLSIDNVSINLVYRHCWNLLE